jgi:glyoxylase-like metal-dependent hydrolase (beta-lactamase superfamily II)
MNIETFFDPATFTLTYVVSDPATRDAVIIDPVLDYDPLAVSTSTESADRVLDFVRSQELHVRAVLETHAHADHLSSAPYLHEKLGAPVLIGRHIVDVQEVFAGVFHQDFATDGSQFDHLLDDGEVYEAGSLKVKALHTPGHTPACMSYVIGDAVFTGDALFMPDFGVGRCDFPKGSAEALYDAITEKLYTLPDDTRVFVGHDYQPGGRELAYESTIGEEKAKNVQLPAGRARDAFIEFRTSRDATLRPPKLLFPSVQVNANGGRLPEPEANGRRYLKLPVGLFD